MVSWMNTKLIIILPQLYLYVDNKYKVWYNRKKFKGIGSDYVLP